MKKLRLGDLFSIFQLVSRVGIKTLLDSKAWSPNHPAILLPILPEIEEGKGYWAGRAACAEHRGGGEMEASEEVKRGKGDWGCRGAESVR